MKIKQIVHFLLKIDAFSVFSSWNKSSLTINNISYFVNFVNFFLLKCLKKCSFYWNYTFINIHANYCALYFLSNEKLIFIFIYSIIGLKSYIVTITATIIQIRSWYNLYFHVHIYRYNSYLHIKYYQYNYNYLNYFIKNSSNLLSKMNDILIRLLMLIYLCLSFIDSNLR